MGEDELKIELIDKDKAINALITIMREHSLEEDVQSEIILCLLNVPTVEAKPVVHGKWIEYEVPHIICCSECDWGTGIDEKGFKFCPNCGADMRGEKHD